MSDLGTVPGDSLGYHEAVASLNLEEGTYWLVAVVQNETTTQPTVSAITPRPIGNSAGLSACTGGSCNGYYSAAISGALPTNYSIAVHLT